MEQETQKLLGSALKVGLSLAVVFGVVWVAGKAWKRSQEARA